MAIQPVSINLTCIVPVQDDPAQCQIVVSDTDLFQRYLSAGYKYNSALKKDL